MAHGSILAVDVGGTFTDAVLVTSDGRIHTGKTPTTPDDQSAGVIDAARQALAAAGREGETVTAFVNGMTITTNAMLEGRFARTALLATRGFTDIEELARQNRADLYRLQDARPAPIVPPGLRFAIDERCGLDGVIDPLDERSAIEALERCGEAGVQAIAVCLLFSFRHPEHELRIGELAADLVPGVHVSLSHQVVGTFREYERCATTIADAALAPLLTHYLGELSRRAAAARLPAPDVMLSNGGSVPAETAARNAATTVLSGPAGGAVGAGRVAARRGARRALGFDMGGTSTDIAVVHDGRALMTASREIAGRPVALPAVDIVTVGAGGGSIAWRDSGGALRVGPRSAGARPGPACYGHGGDLPTVTDANLLLGRLGDRSALAGGLRLDRAAAERVVGGLARQLGLSTIRTAEGIVRIADLEMLRATGSATIARGIDPRDHALVAFGGAGPMHAAAIAQALSIETVVCPHACGVLSAYGIAAGGRRRDRSRSLVKALAETPDAEIQEIVGELRESAAEGLPIEGTPQTQVTCELRYRGQAFELPVIATTGTPRAQALAEAFHDAHERAYGYADRDAAVELVTIRVSVTTAGPRELEPHQGQAQTSPDDDSDDSAIGSAPEASGPGERTATPTRRAWFDGRPHETLVLREVSPLAPVDGPAVIEQPQATVVVPPGWRVTAQSDGDLVLTSLSPRTADPANGAARSEGTPT